MYIVTLDIQDNMYEHDSFKKIETVFNSVVQYKNRKNLK